MLQDLDGYYEELSHDQLMYEQGYIHIDELVDPAAVVDVLKDMVKAVYETGDVEELILSLQTLGDWHEYDFSLEVDGKDAKIQKKTHPLMGWHLGYQKALLDINFKNKEVKHG